MKKSVLSFILILYFSSLKAQPGSQDFSFSTEFDFQPSESLNSVIVQPDQKIVIGGAFKVPYYKMSYGNIIRLNENGSVDSTFKIITGFNRVGFGGGVIAMGLQTDGKIIVGGGFNTFNDQSCNTIVRLNTDGSIDYEFKKKPFYNVLKITIQNDNKIIVVYYDGKSKIQRLNADGSSDPSFKIVETDAQINTVLLQKDNKILIQGEFITVNDEVNKYTARINADGTLDYSFNPVKKLKTIGFVNRICLQKDQKIVIGSLNLNNTLVRLLETGEIDSTFNTGNSFALKNSTFGINTIYVTGNGKTIVGGVFMTKDEKNHNIVGLNADGTIDTAFNTGSGFDDGVQAICRQGDKLIVSGFFNTFNSVFSGRIVRLNTISKSKVTTLSIFPNPTSGILTIRAPQKLKSITLFDCTGKQVLRTESLNDNKEIDLTSIAEGLYFVKLALENETVIRKIVKQ